MSQDPTGYAAVAVGPSREAATGVFGELFDDLFVTTFEDLEREVDLAGTGTVAVADGPGAAELVSALLGSAEAPELVVEMPADADRRRAVAELVAQHPEIGVVDTRRAADHGAASWPAAVAEVRAEPGVPAQVPARARPEPVAVARGLRGRLADRLGRTGILVLCTAAVAGVLGVLVLVLIGRSDLGADGVLVTITLGIAVVQVVTVAGLAYLVLALRRARGETQEFQGTVLRRTGRLLDQGTSARRRSTSQGRKLTRVLKAGAREQKHHEYVVELGRQLNRLLLHTRDDGRRLHLATQRQTQALLNLHDLVAPQAAVPPAGGWAASPDLLLFCVDTLLADRPTTVVECGSGVSTLYLALAAEQHGLATKVVALEHDERFAEATRALLERHGVSGRAEVRFAPLEPSSVPGHETPWYAESALEGLEDIGMLIVDGPPTATGPQARYPAVPLLKSRLAARCVIVMDDLIRESDHETADAWSELLPDFDYNVVRELEKHLGLLRRG